jgi:hypothetical protein
MRGGLRPVLMAGAVAAAGMVPAVLHAQAPVSVTLGGRVHYQWNTTSLDAAEAGATTPIASNTFETRRVRLEVGVQAAGWMRGLMEPEFTLGRLALRQVWVAFDVDSGLVVKAGQMKKPFGAVLLTSSSRLPIIERSVRIRGLDEALVGAGQAGALRGETLAGEHHLLLETQRYSAYEMGVQLEARRGPLELAAGVFNGSGADQRDENDGKSMAGRLTWRAPSGPPLALSVAWSHRELNWPTPQSPDTRSGNAFAVDAQLGEFRRGWWLIGELVTGDNLVSEERFVGGHAIAAWFRPTGGRKVEGVEPVGRISWADPDRSIEGDAGVLLTPGVNFYFFGRSRLMLNWDVYLPEGDGVATQHAARAQVNLQF